MQLLTFTAGDETYAIESRRVVEVLPLVPARPIPRMPDYVRGVFVHRGRLVPLVDLAIRLAGRPPTERLSTRSIVVQFSSDPAAAPVHLGIVAENVVSFCSDSDCEASLPALHAADAPYLGRMLRIGGRTVQMIDVEHLLPPELQAALVPGSPTPLPDAS
jgi:chemotaxis-related protein WspB